MKKSFAIIALAALVMLAGCKKNDPKPNGTRLIAGIEKHKSDSKTSLDGLQIKWSEGDKLYVNNGNTSATFTLVSGAGTTTGEFATEGDYTFAAENNLAVYPYNDNITVSGTTVTMTLPAEQTASGAGTFGNNANPMLGTFSDMDNLTLTSLCGVLCLQLTGNNVNITGIEIVGGPDDKLNGTFTVDYTNPVLTYSANGTNSVRLNCEATLTSTAQKFYVVLPAGTLNGFTMKVYDGNNEIFSKSTANEVPVSVNTLSTMTPVEVVPFNPLTTPLTFEARVANVSVGFGGSAFAAPALEYSKNGGEWTSFPGQITLENVGDIVSFRGNNSSTVENQFSCSGQCYIYGNVMSLLHADDYATNYTLASSAFYQLFMGNTNIDIHPDKDLVLPATTLAYYCYREMFRGCESLTKAPALPAETLTDYCYDRMFMGCTSLTTAPELPATTLANNCYRYMFRGCASLTTAPELPATTLASSCYSNMFLFCASLTTAPELPATTLASSCYSGMFQGCASLTTAPELPAETLTNSCYSSMFRGCSQLSSITCLATSGVNEENTDSWVDGVASTGTFYADPSATWPTGTNGIPSGWTRKNPDGSDWVEPVPAGAINGLFSVSATQQVWFSQGNLQATTSDLGVNWTWAFATNQWDYIGDAAANNAINGNGTVSTNGTVDLFGWSTAATYYGIYNSGSNADYSGDFVDWGGLTIGGAAPGTWRTLTKDEWVYLFNARPGIRFAKATVNDICGVIILPDNWDSGIYTLNDANALNYSNYNKNIISEADWNNSFEPNGAVFLPAAGYRGTLGMTSVNSNGSYWASTEYGAEYANRVSFSSAFLGPSGYNQRYYGSSVRLVSDAN